MLEEGFTRRDFVSVSAVGIAGLALAGRSAAAHDDHHHQGMPFAAPVLAAVPRDAFSGGGTLRAAYGEATFSLSAFPGTSEEGVPVIQGSLVLEDQSESSNPVNIVTEWFDSSGPYTTSLPDARQIIGWARVNDGWPMPFVLQLEDLGMPGSGEDTFNLVLGTDAHTFLGGVSSSCNCGGFSYNLRSNVVTGDLTRFDLE